MFGLRSVTQKFVQRTKVSNFKTTPLKFSTLSALRNFSTEPPKENADPTAPKVSGGGIGKKVKGFHEFIKSSQMYEPRLEPDDDKEAEPLPIPVQHRRIFLLGSLLMLAGLVALALEQDLDDLPNPNMLSEEERKNLPDTSYLYHMMKYNFVSFIKSIVTPTYASNTKQDDLSMVDQLQIYFQDPNNRDVIKVYRDLIHYVVDVYDKVLFTYEVWNGLNTPMMDLQYSLEYNPMVSRPHPTPYMLACSYPDLGTDKDDGFLLRRTDCFFFGRLPGMLHEPMMNMYNHYVDRDIMLGRSVMSFEDFINPDHKFIYDPSFYANGYPFDPTFLVTPKLTMIADTSRVKEIQQSREKKKLFEHVSYVDSVAKIF